MSDPSTPILIATAAWAVVLLTIQVLRSWNGGRSDYSRKAGSIPRAVLYNFTLAMSPFRKETAFLHWFKFIAGVIMHAGAISAIITAIRASLFNPAPVPKIMALVFLPAAAASVYLLFRRYRTEWMRNFSTPDDYLSALLTLNVILMAFFFSTGITGALPVIYSTSLVFLYIPLGKLRHIAFFFIARADYSKRLGYRGVYPPVKSLDLKPRDGPA